MPTTEEHVTRIVERLRRDHPDPALREELYADGKLGEYVRTLMNGHDVNDATIEKIAADVRAAEDGAPHH
ncbi:MAG: hypothetical protein H0T46_12810 [Deltaproteobacteria bacterium]|nr:hypothetical protein [Deltaproteobacteria bacterium]